MKQIRVLYDYQILLAQKYGGISRYFYELLMHIGKEKGVDAECFCIGNRNKYFEQYFNSCTDKLYRGEGFLNRVLTRIKMRKYDIIHPTYYNPYVLKQKRKKIIVTVYDMIHEIYPEYFGKDVSVIKDKREMIYGANHIIAISESTKKDILKFYPDIDPNKISVIYIGSNMSIGCEKKEIDLPERFVLFVGTRNGYKNFCKFVSAIKPILTVDKTLYVVCIGGGAFSQTEIESFGSLNDRFVQINAFDEQMAYAYSKAQCFVFPSLYEGFGIPTLEAFACECPAVISNTSSMPEVGGDAALYFDPNNVEEMKTAIEGVLKNKAFKDELVRRGKLQLKKFDWEKIAEETINCYKYVLKDGGKR